MLICRVPEYRMLVLLALMACHHHVSGDDTDDVVVTPPEPGPGDLAFSDQTAAVGLEGANASQVEAVDLDGDGYPDLIASDNAGIDDFASGDAPHYHHLWMNRDDGNGGRVFVDATEESGLWQRRDGDGGRPSVDHAFADVDGDGDVDVFAGVFNDPHTDPDTHFTDVSEVMLNDGTGHFTFAPVSADFQQDFPMIGVSFTDYDGDGVVDLYMGEWYKNADIYGDGSWLNWIFGANDRLFHGNGDGTFTDVTEDAGLILDERTNGAAQSAVLNGSHARPTMGVTTCDLDGDGFDELVEMAYGRQWNLLWHNRGDGTFGEVGKASGYAGDDNVDYTDNWYYECYCWSNGSCDQPTDPDFPYKKSQCDYIASSGYWNPGWDDQPANLNGNTFTTACADIDGDGDLDLLHAEITHEWAGKSSDLTGVLLNDGVGSFTPLDLAASGLDRDPVKDPNTGAWDFGDQASAIADLDNDGRADIIVPSGAAYYGNFLYVWRQWDTLQFSEVEHDVGLDVPTARGMALADFDRDGDLDMVTTSLSEVVDDGSEIDHQLWYYRNDTPPTHFLRVALDSGQSNSVGIGARVAVTAGGKTQVKEVGGGYGQHGMQQEIVLTFGLGDAKSVDGVEVTWAGGAKDSYEDVPSDTQVLLKAGGEVEEQAP